MLSRDCEKAESYSESGAAQHSLFIRPKRPRVKDINANASGKGNCNFTKTVPSGARLSFIVLQRTALALSEVRFCQSEIHVPPARALRETVPFKTANASKATSIKLSLFFSFLLYEAINREGGVKMMSVLLAFFTDFLPPYFTRFYRELREELNQNEKKLGGISFTCGF